MDEDEDEHDVTDRMSIHCNLNSTIVSNCGGLTMSGTYVGGSTHEHMCLSIGEFLHLLGTHERVSVVRGTGTEVGVNNEVVGHQVIECDEPLVETRDAIMKDRKCGSMSLCETTFLEPEWA